MLACVHTHPAAACRQGVAAQQQAAHGQALSFRRAVGGGGASPMRAAAGSSAVAAPPASRTALTCHAVAAPERPAPPAPAAASGRPPLKVLIAGGGIGGLVLAVGLLKRGFDVTVLERDMTAIRGEGKYRGPIQVRAHGSSSAVPCCRC